MTPDKAVNWQHIPAEVQRSVAERLQLEYVSGMQDWAIEVADPARFDDLLSAYREETWTDWQRACLMEVLIASADQLNENAVADAFTLLEPLLSSRWDIHAGSVAYWALLEDGSPDGFLVTPYLRALLSKNTRLGLR